MRGPLMRRAASSSTHRRFSVPDISRGGALLVAASWPEPSASGRSAYVSCRSPKSRSCRSECPTPSLSV
eukprot:3132674-Prymnesium_polylepis.1